MVFAETATLPAVAPFGLPSTIRPPEDELQKLVSGPAHEPMQRLLRHCPVHVHYEVEALAKNHETALGLTSRLPNADPVGISRTRVRIESVEEWSARQ
jgi:hypothetical protein